MQRVAFLIGNERLGCLLNPESLVVRRQAGVRARRSAGGLVASAALSDDALLYTGGGRTEIAMKLLFDVSLAGSSIPSQDVRDLTGPIWRLAETRPAGDRTGDGPVCRFVWGKPWNIAGIITSIAERFERFTREGAPQRSWMSLLFRRVPEPSPPPPQTGGAPFPSGWDESGGIQPPFETYEVRQGERPDQITQACYRDPSLSRALMAYNGIADPMHIPPGTILDVPRLSELEALR